MRVAVVGSRDFANLALVRKFVRRLPRDTVVVSGGARGVDATAERTAIVTGLRTDIYLADWEGQGKSAGFIRNALIADACDQMVAFWDGDSNGTRNAIREARRAGKKTLVIDVNGNILPGETIE